ncbi:hypothetical protein Y1Q_0007136 [Alligator mississippiensis]|uniref:Uncharacterized protein n=1 Tax=Alligator mississippiensis TaxID=8496 RepID=A0A151N6I6_ALLMI|nr:hypothetical protein Y1Q_0007136 [Alligator mississippiensis]
MVPAAKIQAQKQVIMRESFATPAACAVHVLGNFPKHYNIQSQLLPLAAKCTSSLPLPNRVRRSDVPCTFLDMDTL